MFLTEAFNLDILKDKYKGVTNVMRAANDEYQKIVQSEVSTKVSLRQLQIRQNRTSMEKELAAGSESEREGPIVPK